MGRRAVLILVQDLHDYAKVMGGVKKGPPFRCNAERLGGYTSCGSPVQHPMEGERFRGLFEKVEIQVEIVCNYNY